MLEDDDAAVIRQWLAQSLPHANDGRRAALARYCNVTPQAVNGWLRTGRMRKANVVRAAEFLGCSPGFAPGPARVMEPPAAYAPAAGWPFARISQARVLALSPADLARLEGAVLVAAAHLGLTVAP